VRLCPDERGPDPPVRAWVRQEWPGATSPRCGARRPGVTGPHPRAEVRPDGGAARIVTVRPAGSGSAPARPASGGRGVPPRSAAVAAPARRCRRAPWASQPFPARDRPRRARLRDGAGTALRVSGPGCRPSDRQNAARRGRFEQDPAKPAGRSRKRTVSEHPAGGRNHDTILSDKARRTKRPRLCAQRFNAQQEKKQTNVGSIAFVTLALASTQGLIPRRSSPPS